MTTAVATLALSAEAQELLFRNARTANSFTDAPVTDEQIQAVYDLVKWAPTSMNMQPLRVVLVRSTDARAKLVDLMADGNKAKTGTAPLVAILAADVNFHDELHKTFPIFPGARDVFAGDDDGAREHRQVQRGLAGRLLHPGRTRGRSGRRPDDRLRRRRHQLRVLRRR